MKRDFIGLAAIIGLVAGAGCATDPTDSLSQGIGSVATSVAYTELKVGDSVAVIAETKDNQDVTIAELPTVTSATPSIVSVTDAYVPPLPEARFYVKALAYGEGQVTATAGGKTATITVQTLPAAVTIGGAPDTLGSGASAQLVPNPLDVGANPVTMDAALFTWSSDAASVISVDSAGMATAQAPGTATVTVEGPGGVTADVAIVVVAGTFAGTFSSSSSAPGTLVTATKAAGGPDFDSDTDVSLDGTPAWVEAFTASTLTFAVPATGSTAAGVLTLAAMGPNQLAQNAAFTATLAVDAWSNAGNVTDDCSAAPTPVNYNTQKAASGWLYFSHVGTSQGDRGCQNGGSGFDHYFTYTTGGTAQTVEVRTEWLLDGDNDLYVCTMDLSSCPATGFSGESFNEVIPSVTLAANTTYMIIYSPWTAAGGGNSIRMRIQ